MNEPRSHAARTITVIPAPPTVIPAQAGIQGFRFERLGFPPPRE
jgi:hypothetical protein